MEFKEYSKGLETIGDYVKEAQRRGVVLVAQSCFGHKGMLVPYGDKIHIVDKRGVIRGNNLPKTPFGNSWKLLGEIDFSTELD